MMRRSKTDRCGTCKSITSNKVNQILKSRRFFCDSGGPPKHRRGDRRGNRLIIVNGRSDRGNKGDRI